MISLCHKFTIIMETLVHHELRLLILLINYTQSGCHVFLLWIWEGPRDEIKKKSYLGKSLKFWYHMPIGWTNWVKISSLPIKWWFDRMDCKYSLKSLTSTLVRYPQISHYCFSNGCQWIMMKVWFQRRILSAMFLWWSSYINVLRKLTTIFAQVVGF